MKPSKLLSFRRSHLRAPLLRDEASDAAMADAEEGVRVGPAQKAAAWQWFMRGGASAEAPLLHVEASVRRGPPTPMASSLSHPPSRFAHEAAALRPQTPPPSPPSDDIDLARLGAALSDQSARHRPQKLGQDEASCPSLRTADGHAEKKKARMVQPNDRRGLHLHFLGFQKLLRRLLPSLSGRKSMAASMKSDSEEEAQHHYHRCVYHHHHHHHHYYYGGAASSADDACLAEQPHPSTAQPHRRRHSEGGLHPLVAQQYHLCAESRAGTRKIEEEYQQNEFNGDKQTFSKHDHALRRHMKPAAGGEAAVKRQTINDLLLPPIERTASERFTGTTNTAWFSDEDETQSRVARCNSERRRPFHLQNRIISVDAQNHYFLSGQFFDSSDRKLPNDAAGAMASPAIKRRARRHSANFSSFPLHSVSEDVHIEHP